MTKLERKLAEDQIYYRTGVYLYSLINFQRGKLLHIGKRSGIWTIEVNNGVSEFSVQSEFSLLKAMHRAILRFDDEPLFAGRPPDAALS